MQMMPPGSARTWHAGNSIRVDRNVLAKRSASFSRKGYAQVQALREWHALWAEVAGEKMAASSVVSKCTRGVLHVIVANSLLLQELGFRKKELLARIRELSDHKVRDVRFRIAPLD